MTKRTLDLIIEAHGAESKEGKKAIRKYNRELKEKAEAAIGFYMMFMNMQ